MAVDREAAVPGWSLICPSGKLTQYNAAPSGQLTTLPLEAVFHYTTFYWWTRQKTLILKSHAGPRLCVCAYVTGKAFCLQKDSQKQELKMNGDGKVSFRLQYVHCRRCTSNDLSLQCRWWALGRRRCFPPREIRLLFVQVWGTYILYNSQEKKKAKMRVNQQNSA